MDHSSSELIAKHPEVPFFMIDFNLQQLNVLNAESVAVSILRKNLNRHFKGVEEERKLDIIVFKCKKTAPTLRDPDFSDVARRIGYPESKFEGQPFLTCMCSVLEELSRAGYIKLFSSNLSWWTDADVWFFFKSPDAIAEDIEICAIDLLCANKIHLFNCPQEVEQAMSFTVCENWEKVKRAEKGDVCYKLKLKGSPWMKTGGPNSVKGRVLVLKMLQCMSSYGWSLYSSCNIDGQTDTLFFCRKPSDPTELNVYSPMFALSLNRDERLRLINANDSVLDCIRGVLENRGVDVIREKDKFGYMEFKLGGKPWAAEKDDCIPVISLLCAIFSSLRRLGWRMLMNIELIWSATAKGVFYFTKATARETKYCALSLKSSNLIYGINMNQNIKTELTKVFRPFEESQPEEANQYPMKWISSSPLWSTEDDLPNKIKGQMLVARMVHTLMTFNYHLCSSARVSGLFVTHEFGPDWKPDADTLFFALDELPLNVGFFTDRPENCKSDEILCQFNSPYPLDPLNIFGSPLFFH